MKCLCADVVTPAVPDRQLSYSVSAALKDTLSVGMLIYVPFRRGTILALVIKIYDHDTELIPFRLKEIAEINHNLPVLSEDLVALLLWMREYYLATFGSLLETMLPSSAREDIAPKRALKLEIAKFLTDDELKILSVKSPKQRALYDFVRQSGDCVAKKDVEQFSDSVANALFAKGILRKNFSHVFRSVYDDFSDSGEVAGQKDISLTEEQIAAANSICASLRHEKFCVHLLHGITGSGKTEVYLESIREVLIQGGSAIYLVPELALTPQTVNRIRKGLHLTAIEVVVWHSGLSVGERRDAWHSMATGQAKIVIGARSAIFAPFKKTKLIIVDEEHESAYKQSESPRYNARDVAVYRAKLCNATCVLGSATPSIESFFNASLGRYRLDILPTRVDGNRLPEVEIVDMRQEKRSTCGKVISLRLQDLISERLIAKEQIILFLNKRGYSSTIFCGDCDYTANCPSCSTSLTYHKHENCMRCHMCTYKESLPVKCPKCGSCDILQHGVGTQQLVSVAENLFPGAKIERIDSDVMTSKGKFHKILKKFAAGDIDILVGTQMISKGLDFPNVSLVGIINIDGAMNFPDFRANERAFQSIIQVAGRAGRGQISGTVVVQTRCPRSELVQLAITSNFENFLKKELAMRQEFGYPPFFRLIRLIFSGKNEVKTKFFAEKFSVALQNVAGTTLKIRGPAAAPIFKANNRYRFSSLIFTKHVTVSLSSIQQALNGLKKTNEVNIAVDVDPVDMM